MRKRAQTNYEVEPIPEFEPMAKFPKLIFPVFWTEDFSQLNEEYASKIRGSLVSPLKMKSMIQWTLIVIGLIGTFLSIFMMQFFRKSQVTNIQNPENIAAANAVNTIHSNVIQNID